MSGARIQNRPSQIAGKRRAKRGNIPGEASIVPGQIGKAIRRDPIVDAVELRPVDLPSGS